MARYVFFVLVSVLTQTVFGGKKSWGIVGNPLAHFLPCNGSDNIMLTYEPGLPPGEENQYWLSIQEDFPKHSRIYLKFDSEATVTLGDATSARISAHFNDVFTINFFKSKQNLAFTVKGPATGTIPYITSININTVEYCENHQVGYLDDLVMGYVGTAHTQLSVPDDACGRRKITHTELITNGLETKPGDWPWHAAIYRLKRQSINYICGGTLISKSLILTAAHCTSLNGVPVVPEILSVVLGKYNLIGGDIAAQEREVHQVIQHENFNHTNLNNDIALLKLKSEATYTDYVQPACIWQTNDYKKVHAGQLYGTVIGWGFDQRDTLSSQLRQASIPRVSDSVCIKSNPLFFTKMLTGQKFCAGYANGTSACNGDSGGGFHVFVPDTSGDTSPNATGTWHVHGIISVAVARTDVPICDSYQYVLFTEVDKYREWIQVHMNR